MKCAPDINAHIGNSIPHSYELFQMVRTPLRTVFVCFVSFASSIERALIVRWLCMFQNNDSLIPIEIDTHFGSTYQNQTGIR